MTDQASTTCPFCGDHGELDEVGAGASPVYIVICNGCAAFGPPGATPEEASANWDRRAFNVTAELIA